MNNKIDFVILWVDGNDPKWIKEKEKYLDNKKLLSASKSRFRDWDNLQYWFRGVEKFAPWVNNVYFITWGHLPKWLNTNNPKLKVINHKDYLKKEDLPTFNSNAIELRMHEIKGLSENFVAFNDDTFIIDNVKETDFFINGIPRDSFAENPIIAFGTKSQTAHASMNNMDVINRNFNKRKVYKKHPFKYFNIKYGIKNFRTLLLLPWYAFCGIQSSHLPVSYCKKTFYKVWEKEGDLLSTTCSNRFRKYNDLSHWAMRNWQLCEGNFIPRSKKYGKYFNVSKDNTELVSHIVNRKTKTICLNDTNDDIDFEKSKNEIIAAFEKILPEKSSFEK